MKWKSEVCSHQEIQDFNRVCPQEEVLLCTSSSIFPLKFRTKSWWKWIHTEKQRSYTKMSTLQAKNTESPYNDKTEALISLYSVYCVVSIIERRKRNSLLAMLNPPPHNPLQTKVTNNCQLVSTAPSTETHRYRLLAQGFGLHGTKSKAS